MTEDGVGQPGGVVRSVPALVGYVVLYAVAAALCSVAVTAMLLGAPGTGGGLADAVGGFFVTALFSVFWGAPVAMVLTPLLHVVLARSGSQWVHVLGFGLAFAAGVELELLVVSGELRDWSGMLVMAGIAGASAALGRLAVTGERWRVHPSADWMRELHR